MCSIQVHTVPLQDCEWTKSIVTWVGEGGLVALVEEGHMTLLHTIPYRARLGRYLLYTSIPWPVHTTVRLKGWLRLTARPPLESCTISPKKIPSVKYMFNEQPLMI